MYVYSKIYSLSPFVHNILATNFWVFYFFLGQEKYFKYFKVKMNQMSSLW
jgi:hypothetical protein